MFVVDPPADPAPDDGLSLSETEGRDLVALPDRDFVVFGTARFGDETSPVYYGWAARVGADGRTKWSRAFPGPAGTQQLFHFGKRLAAGELLAGGRQQVGPGDPKCTSWSKGLVVWIDAGEGTILKEPVLLGDERGRMALYGGAEDQAGALFFTGFVTAEVSGDPKRLCQDDQLVLRTDAAGKERARRAVGSDRENDIGHDVERLADRHLLVGLEFDEGFGGMVEVFSDDPQADTVYRRFREGSGGRDRFVAAAEDPISRDYLVVGSWSASEDDPNKAWWYSLDPDDLATTGGGKVADHPASALNGVAALPNGRVLAVGSARPDGETQAGWSLILHEGVLSAVEISDKLRIADASRPRLDTLPRSGDAYVLDRLDDQPVGFFHDALKPGDRLALDFETAQPSDIRIVVHPEEGDVDLLLSRTDGALADFSNYRGKASEVIEEALPKGQYRLEIIAQSDVAALDLSLVAAIPIASLDAAANVQLPRDARRALAGMLGGLGYFSGAEIDIAASPETIRAFMALQDATGEVVDGIIAGSVLVAGLAGIR